MLHHAAKSKSLMALRWSKQQYARKNLLSRHFSVTSSLREEASEVKGISYSALTVGIPKENFPLEKRVAASPEVNKTFFL